MLDGVVDETPVDVKESPKKIELTSAEISQGWNVTV